MKKYLPIAFFLLQAITIPASGLNITQNCIEQMKLANLGKISGALAVSFVINAGLDYISTLAHEHAHGIVSRDNYEITDITPWPSKNFPLFWTGNTRTRSDSSKMHKLLICLAGPLAGASLSYLQYICLKSLEKKYNTSTFLSYLFSYLKEFRMFKILNESLYGFLPYNFEGKGDGEKAWKLIFGDNCPTFTDAQAFMTILTISAVKLAIDYLK